MFNKLINFIERKVYMDDKEKNEAVLFSEEEKTGLSIEDVQNINEILLNTQEQCRMIDSFIENQIKIKDELINRLYDDLSYYREESADRFTDQLMKALIKIRKDMKRQMASKAWTDLSQDELRKEYQYIYEDITDLLEQQNVDEYVTGEGEDFDPAIHLAKVEVTHDIDLNKKIKSSISEGYKKGDKVIMPERVLVYQYKGEE